MSAVLSEIDRIKRQEQAATWDRNEKLLAERVALEVEVVVDVPLTSLESLTQQQFVEWCSAKAVRHCPAKPSTVAAFILDSRLKHDRMLDALNVIARLHNKYSLSNPVATSVVRAVLETVMDDAPPRSWTKAEKELYSFLPTDIRAAISRREREREKYLSQTRNEIAEARKQATRFALEARGNGSNGESKSKTKSDTTEPHTAAAN